jgi:hypothetical protein
MNSRFPILSALSAILRIAGLLSLLGGGWLLLGWLAPDVLIDLLKPLRGWSGLIGLGLVANGLAALVTGELIGVLFAIEENTRKSVPPPTKGGAEASLPSEPGSRNPSAQ